VPNWVAYPPVAASKMGNSSYNSLNLAPNVLTQWILHYD